MVETKNNSYTKELVPYYEGFKGNISKINDTKYLIKGVYEKLDSNTIRIVELPIGTWTDDYKRFLENNIRKNFNLKGLPIKIIYKKSKNPFNQK